MSSETCDWVYKVLPVVKTNLLRRAFFLKEDSYHVFIHGFDLKALDQI